MDANLTHGSATTVSIQYRSKPALDSLPYGLAGVPPFRSFDLRTEKELKTREGEVPQGHKSNENVFANNRN